MFLILNTGRSWTAWKWRIKVKKKKQTNTKATRHAGTGQWASKAPKHQTKPASPEKLPISSYYKTVVTVCLGCCRRALLFLLFMPVVFTVALDPRRGSFRLWVSWARAKPLRLKGRDPLWWLCILINWPFFLLNALRWIRFELKRSHFCLVYSLAVCVTRQPGHQLILSLCSYLNGFNSLYTRHLTASIGLYTIELSVDGGQRRVPCSHTHTLTGGPTTHLIN